MPSHGSRSMTASDQSDLKKLKSRYSSQLATLRELFADWSDDDLLFALQEVEGDLDLAIDRISEGHVSQWGEVKSRKSKKEAAQKAKAAAAPVPPPSSNQMSSSSYRPERTQPPRGNNDRSKRGGRHGSRGQRQPTTQSQAPAAATWGTSAPTKSFQPDTGSWASIASTKMNDKGWNADNASGSNAPPNGMDDKEPAQEIKTESEEKPASTEAKTWASLLKSKPKPVEPEKPKQEPEIAETSGWDEPKDAAQDGWDTKDDGGWDTKDNWDNKDSWDASSAPADPWTSSTTEPVQESVDAATAAAPKESEPEPVNEPEQHVDITEDETPKEEPVPKKTPVDRRPKQDAPVVLPNNGTSSLSSIGVKFGSLTLDDNAADSNNEINDTTLQAEIRYGERMSV
ncbi:hypothetical protein K492DRAFT_80589 [Lichtheimia hyalospora FSU 10163]|nr:hypothetical protein K492DRAFT_80589 [Lichtheimia hyalospora FSU 10163]